MKITGRTTLFFDASMLVAGAHSQEGSSALLLEACKAGGFTAQATFLVILEALHTLERHFPQRSMERFQDYLVGIHWALLPVPPEDVLQEYASFVHPEDVHLLAAAVEGKSEFLLTLDRRHILVAAQAIEEAGLAVRILRPGDFIQQYYPLHEAYFSLPPRRG